MSLGAACSTKILRPKLPEVLTMLNGNRKYMCLTLDLEEDWTIHNQPEYNPTFEYLDDYIEMIAQVGIPLSIFVMGRTIDRHGWVVDKIRKNLDVEFHLHSYQHDITKSYDFDEEVARAIEAYESFFGETPIGYRAPQGNVTPEEWIKLEDAGFQFDSSIFPSYRPGVYNNLSEPTSPYYPDVTENLLEIPFSVVPRLRIPIAQNYLKLLGRPYRYLLRTAALPDLIVFDSHLQDFYLTKFYDNLDFPQKYLMLRNLDESKDIFIEFMENLKIRGYEFIKISDVYNAM